MQLHMTLDEIKQEFVSFMEEARATEPYPRNFMGCLISLLIDPSPVSQERIVELTGYSQATVSMTLQKLRLLMPIRIIRTRGDRKHYYEYDGTPWNFIIDLWQKRLESQAISSEHIEKMIRKVKEEYADDDTLERFSNYLEYLSLVLREVGDLRKSSIEEFGAWSKTDSQIRLKDWESATIDSNEAADFLNYLRGKSLEYAKSKMMENSESRESLELMREYFSGFKTEINPLFSQEAANQLIVIHSVFLDGWTTQKQIEQVTLLPKSTISEVLSGAIASKLITVTKKKGSKIKFYHPQISFTDLLLGNFTQVDVHISKVIPQLVKFTKQVKKIPNSLNNKAPFLNALKSLEDAYVFTREFSRIMKIKLVEKLKEEIESGHAFI